MGFVRNIPDIQKLPVVCNDAGNSTWRYDMDKDCYYRLYPSGDYVAIKRKYIPNPETLWDNKVRRIAKPDAITIAHAKPSQAVYALHKHAIAIDDKKH